MGRAKSRLRGFVLGNGEDDSGIGELLSRNDHTIW